jgi:hypothetical protein
MKTGYDAPATGSVARSEAPLTKQGKLPWLIPIYDNTHAIGKNIEVSATLTVQSSQTHSARNRASVRKAYIHPGSLHLHAPGSGNIIRRGESLFVFSPTIVKVGGFQHNEEARIIQRNGIAFILPESGAA